jgi:hypothetical protein
MREFIIKLTSNKNILFCLLILASCQPTPDRSSGHSNSTSSKPVDSPSAINIPKEFKEVLQKKEAVPTQQDMSLDDSCELMENIELENKRKYLSDKHGNYRIYESAVDSKLKTYYVKDLIQNHFEAFSFRKKKNAINLQKKLAYNAINEILEKQKSFMGIVKISDLKDNMEELKTCLQSDDHFSKLAPNAVIENNIESKGLYEAFIINNLINAFKARILFVFINELEEEKQKELKRLRVEHKINARGRLPLKINNQILSIKKKYDERKEIAFLPLGTMMQASPLLFQFDNSFSVTDWVDTTIIESDFMKSLLMGFSDELMNQLKENFKKYPNILSFENIVLAPRNQFYLDEFVRTKIQNKEIKELIQSGLENYINTINDGAEKICKDKGKELHHNEDLVKFVLDNNVLRDNYKNIMVRDHAGYCHLRETQPKQDLKKFTWKTGVGFTLVGVGAGLQVFLGLGTGAGLIAMGAGGALLTGETAYNSYISYEQKVRGQAVHFGGWSDYRNVIGLVNQTNDLYTDLGTDAVLTVIGASGGKILTKFQKANKMAEDDIINDLEKMNPNVSKYQRGNINQTLIKIGGDKSNSLYKKLIWKRHKLMWKEYVKSPSRYKILSKREWYRVRNGNDIPAFHIYGESGEETLGILEIAKDVKRLKTDEGQEVLEKINKWFSDYESYQSEINQAVDAGFQSSKQVPELQMALKKYKAEDFFGGNQITIKLTNVVDGKTTENVNKTFQSLYGLEKYTKEQIGISQSSFARNSLEELTNQSDLYKIMDTQAIDYRRLEFLRDSLKRVDGRSAEQEKLLKKSLALLENKTLSPRPDAFRRLQIKELKAERTDFLRSMKKKEKLLSKMDIKLTDVAANKVKETGAVGNYFKTVIYVGMTGVGTGAVGRYFQTGGSLDEVSSSIDLAWNKFSRNINNGFTTDEKNCAEQGRSFSFMLCFTNLTKKELGVQRARAIVKDDKYSYRTDPEVIKILYDFTYRMLKLRKKLRSAELFVLSSGVLNHSYEIHTKREIVELIEKISNNKEDIGAYVAQILNAETKEEAYQLLSLYEKELGSDFNEALKLIIKNQESVKNSIKESARLPQNIEQLIRGLSFEESEYNINDEDFFELTKDMIDQVQEVIE